MIASLLTAMEEYSKQSTGLFVTYMEFGTGMYLKSKLLYTYRTPNPRMQPAQGRRRRTRTQLYAHQKHPPYLPR